MAYLQAAARKMAEKDFEGIGFRDLFAKALAGIQWFIKIGKHLGSVKQPPVTKLQWRGNADVSGPSRYPSLSVPTRRNSGLAPRNQVLRFSSNRNRQILGSMGGRNEQRHWTSRTDFCKLTYHTHEVARLLDIPPRIVRCLTRRGLLKSSRRGRRYIFTARQVEAFLKQTRRWP